MAVSRSRRWWTVAGAFIAALACGVVGGVVAYAIDAPRAPSAGSSSAASPAACSVGRIAKQELPSVVTISATGAPSASGGAPSGGTGSGEVIRPDGYILTNNHVIASAANGGSLKVTFSDGHTATATIRGREPLADLAVIKASGGGPFRPISFGSSAGVQVGDPAVALGAPLGLSSTVTSGIVSALDRTVRVPVPGENSQALLIDALQTDAAINPGNSGGALVNCDGQLIGVPSAGASVPSSSGQSSPGNIGLGFAIPADLAKQASDEIIANGRVTLSYLGVDAEPVSPNAAPVAGKAEGLLVTAVVPGSPAASAGLRAGDLITTVAGKPAVSTDQLVALMLSKRPGTKVDIGYSRQGRQGTASVVLGTAP